MEYTFTAETSFRGVSRSNPPIGRRTPNDFDQNLDPPAPKVRHIYSRGYLHDCYLVLELARLAEPIYMYPATLPPHNHHNLSFYPLSSPTKNNLPHRVMEDSQASLWSNLSLFDNEAAIIKIDPSKLSAPPPPKPSLAVLPCEST